MADTPNGPPAGGPKQQVSPAVASLTPDEYNSALRQDAQAAEPAPAASADGATPAPTPLVGFWQRLLHGTPGKSRLAEIARSVPRGIAEAGNNAVGAAYDAANSLVDLPLAGVPKPDAAAMSESTNLAYGNHSDDPLASFTETATQIITGLAATRGMGMTNLYAQGAVLDAAVFDPHEAQLAELAARAPNWTGIGLLGKLLSVKGDDDPIVARMKRAAAGAVPVVVLDGLIAGARMIRGQKVLASATATTAEKAAAEETVQKAGETLQNVSDGTHVPTEETPVTISPTADGKFELKTPKNTPWTIPSDEPHPVIFNDQGEAQVQAAVMNDALTSRKAAGEGFTAEQVQQHFDFAKQLASSATPEDAARLAEGTHFNFSYISEPKQVLAQIESISEQFKAAMDAAQGPIPVAETIRIANEAIGGLAPEEAAGVFRSSKGTLEEGVRLLIGNKALRDFGDKLSKFSEVLDARPHDAIAHEEARIALEHFYGLAREVAGANSEAGRSLNILKYRDLAVGKVPAEAAGKAAIEPAVEQFTAGMSHRDIQAQVRMIRMAGGQPKNVYAVARAARVIREKGGMAKAFELFANGLLSGPKTAQTIVASGSALNLFEPIVRMVAGVATMNRALLREGADIMYGNFKYLGENLATAAASFRAGRSILDPQTQHIAFGGLTGEAIRIPGRVAGGAHEFGKVTAYRAYVRAKSLRYWRQEGLDGLALSSRVEDDLRASFDAKTGIAMLPEALKYGSDISLITPLGKDTFGGGFQSFVNNHLEARFIAPFVKISTNIFRYVWKSAPGLNLLNADIRETLAKGGEEAAVIRARSALAGSIYGYGLYQAMQGGLTGRGPSDPNMRSLWLKNHQPYSMKIGGQWISYRGVEPVAMPLGLISDLHTTITEQGEKSVDGSDLAYATVAALTHNLAAKSYAQGITEFANAWANNDPHATQKWMQNFAGSLLVPQGVASTNPDPIYRDVQSLADAVIARIPGWSKTLPPKFDMFGDPILKTPGVVNRNQVFTTKEAKHSVEDDLQALGRSLSPASSGMKFGNLGIDLTDKKTYDNGTGKAPYIRLMELLRKPANGEGSLREAMAALVKSPEWKEASSGATLFPGGEQWIRAAALKTQYEDRALKQVREEYPKLDAQLREARRAQGAAVKDGNAGVKQIEQLFGTLKP